MGKPVKWNDGGILAFLKSSDIVNMSDDTFIEKLSNYLAVSPSFLKSQFSEGIEIPSENWFDTEKEYNNALTDLINNLQQVSLKYKDTSKPAFKKNCGKQWSKSRLH